MEDGQALPLYYLLPLQKVEAYAKPSQGMESEVTKCLRPVRCVGLHQESGLPDEVKPAFTSFT